MMRDRIRLHARRYAQRAAAGLVAADGVACATEAEKAYRDFRAKMKTRPDWGNLPADLERQLFDLHREATRAK